LDPPLARRTPDAAEVALDRPRPGFISKKFQSQGRLSENGRYADKRCSRIVGCRIIIGSSSCRNCMWKDCEVLRSTCLARQGERTSRTSVLRHAASAGLPAAGVLCIPFVSPASQGRAGQGQAPGYKQTVAADRFLCVADSAKNHALLLSSLEIRSFYTEWPDIYSRVKLPVRSSYHWPFMTEEEEEGATAAGIITLLRHI
jgi:hypothetical protein